jgi:zinc protease
MSKLMLILVLALPAFAQDSARIDRRLGNGMRVILMEDHHAPVASYMLLYNFGSADDPADRTGLAHFCEHLVLTRSGEAATRYAALVQSSGGSFNATTGRDSTRFYATVPSAALLQTLAYEVQRMEGREFTAEGFKLEYAVIDNERIQHHEDQPYGAAEDYLDELAASTAAYRHPVIGYLPDLRQITLQDAKQFIAAHYLPQNAVLTIVGDFSAPKLLESVQAMFGGIQSHALSMPSRNQSQTREPHAHTGQYETTDKQAHAARLYFAYPAPNPTSKDASALLLLDVLLTKSQHARLKQALVDSGIAASVKSDMEFRKDGGLFFLIVTLKRPDAADQARAAVDAALQDLYNGSLPAPELRRARLILESQQAEKNEGSRYRAGQMAMGAAFFNAPDIVEGTDKQIRRATDGDIAAVTGNYLLGKEHVTLLVKPVSK